LKPWRIHKAAFYPLHSLALSRLTYAGINSRISNVNKNMQNF
jgi:hypothetical protein